MNSMFRVIVIGLLLAWCGCSGNPTDPSRTDTADTTDTLPDVGSIALHWSDKSLDDFAVDTQDKGTPQILKVTLASASASRQVQFAYSSGSGTIPSLSPGSYDLTIGVYDSAGTRVREGRVTGVTVVANATNNVTVPLTSLVPTAPSSIKVSDSLTTGISISWGAIARAESYSIYRSETAGGTYTLRISTANTSWQDTGVAVATRYYYKVQATSAAGTSPMSPYASGYRKGWRLSDAQYYLPSSGIGIRYDLNAYGYQNVTSGAVVMAVYKNNGVYRVVPGSGYWNSAAYRYDVTPTSATYRTNDAYSFVYTSTWSSAYRNNTYPQYMLLRIYNARYPTDVNNSVRTETAMFPIYWNKSADGSTKASLGEPIILDHDIEIQMDGDGGGTGGESSGAFDTGAIQDEMD